jgi:hypothetical protein
MKLLFFYFCIVTGSALGQSFPLASSLTSGVGTVGSPDPVWQVSSIQASIPSNTLALTYTNAMIANPCTPFGGAFSWVYPSQLSLPFSNGHWILNPSIGCTSYTGYMVYRLPLNLPSDCNGYSLSAPGTYSIVLSVYMDNKLADVRINNISEGLNLTAGNYTLGNNLQITLDGPWLPGVNYIDLILTNNSGVGGIFVGGMMSGCNTALPVELSNFDVRNSDDNVIVSWETQSEKDNDYFLIEKSLDTYSWEFVSKIPSHGNSVVEQSYSFVDDHPNCIETIYYRLMQIDKDQNVSLSDTKSVRCEIDCELFPNPATSEIKIVSKEKIYTVEILDLKNDVIKILSYNEPADRQSVDVSDLHDGVYFLKINDLRIKKLIVHN